MKTAPTKANLMKSKSMLDFSKKGYDLLDKKRNVLIREVMGLVSRAENIQTQIENIFAEAYESLQYTNIIIGTNVVRELSGAISKGEDYDILLHSVMGVEIPKVKYERKDLQPSYGLFRTNATFDNALSKFNEVKYLIYELAEIETAVYKLAMEIKKTQKRANGLDKIQIPKYSEIVKDIENALEEKEREDFFRLKKVKAKTKS
ncbi:MAG: V-type ATP synthase subunit D [Clostridiales bacterium]|nr:V-type ATP synthase subunit D [Clostridiales bacterium]